MRFFGKSVVVLVALFVLGGVLGCEREGPAERAGEKIDETVDKAQEQTEETLEEAKEGTEEVTKEAGKTLN